MSAPNRDAVYFIAPRRKEAAGRHGWRVVKVVEHGPYHDRRPQTWRGPYATASAAYDAATAADIWGLNP